jgi:hypothetical protein
LDGAAEIEGLSDGIEVGQSDILGDTDGPDEGIRLIDGLALGPPAG